MKTKIRAVGIVASSLGALGALSVVFSLFRLVSADFRFSDSTAVWRDLALFFLPGAVLLGVCNRLTPGAAAKAATANAFRFSGLLLMLYGVIKLYRFIFLAPHYIYSATYWIDLALFFAGGLIINGISLKMYIIAGTAQTNEQNAQRMQEYNEEQEKLRQTALEKCLTLLSADMSLPIEALIANCGIAFHSVADPAVFITDIVKELVNTDKFPGMYFDPQKNGLAHLNTRNAAPSGGGEDTLVCPGCLARNTVKKGAAAVCEYCGNALR